VSVWDLVSESAVVATLGDPSILRPDSWDTLIETRYDLMRAVNESLLGDALDVVMSPDGTMAVFTNAILEIPATADQPVTQLVIQDGVHDAAFSPDGGRVLVGNESGLLIFDPEKSDENYPLNGYTNYAPGRSDTPIQIAHSEALVAEAVAFAPDGLRVAGAWEEGGASVFDLASGAEVLQIDDIADAIGVAFAADGTMLALLAGDGRLHLRDADNGAPIVTISDHTAEGTDLVATADGGLVATASADGTVRVYVMDRAELFELARSRLTRTFTADECLRYVLDGCTPEQ
jgi:WD40 repeat protein